MTLRLRLAAVAIALLIPALVLGRWLLVTGTATPTVATPSLPHQVGPWRATTEDRLDAEVLAIIEPDAHVLQLYEAPGRTPIWVYVGVYGGRASYGKGAHDPEVCYPAQGWEILRTESLDVPLADAERLRTRRLEAHLGSDKETVLYWFQPAHRWPAPTAAEELLRVLDAVQGRPQYAFVRLSGPTDGSPAAARDLAEFAAEIAAPIRALLEEIGSDPERQSARLSRSAASRPTPRPLGEHTTR
jgi:EpsI family protein